MTLQTNMAFLRLAALSYLNKAIAPSRIIKIVRIPVNSGVKFAYPTGSRLKYEYTSIDKKLDRGTLDQDAAAAMKRLAKRKMQQAISDVAYAQGSYAAEMEQTALLAEAKAEMKR